MAAPHSLTDRKSQARAHAIALRNTQDPLLGQSLATHLLNSRPPAPSAIVAGFWPIGREIDIRPLLHALHAIGHVIALPATPSRGNPLTFCRWRPDAPMIPERFGTERPDGPEVTPTYLLVPLLAFDRRGHRLGYGGGYYDRTLAALPAATAIGCAYAIQELDEVPADGYDARLTAIATERGVIEVHDADSVPG